MYHNSWRKQSILAQCYQEAIRKCCTVLNFHHTAVNTKYVLINITLNASIILKARYVKTQEHLLIQTQIFILITHTKSV